MYPIYDQQELINSIKFFIETYTKKANHRLLDNNALEADLIWNASRFWTQIIHKSSPLREKYTYHEFLNFKKDYETRNDISVNDDLLFKKFWLRNVLGFIEISGAISSSCRDFDKLKDYKKELEFICFFYNAVPEKERKTVESSALEDTLKNYNLEKNYSIDIKNIYERNWFSKKEDKIELHNLDIYYQPYLDNWEHFQFISALRYEYDKKNKKLQIAKSDFENILTSFRNFHQNTPLLETLVAQKVIQPNESTCFIDFHNADIRYFDLSDKISGYYWELLINDSSLKDDKERILTFLSKIHYWEGSSDVLSFTINEAKKRFLDAAFQLISNEPDLVGIENEFQKVRIDEGMSHGIETIINDRSEIEDFSLDNSDLFELYDSLKNIEHKANRTYLHDQSSRSMLTYLICVVVKYDYETESENNEDEENCQIFHYKRIIKLLKESIDKPSLLWYVVSYIKYNRREIIPYLLIDKDFTSLSFQIMDKFEFPSEERAELSLKLWSNCLLLALITIRSEIKNVNSAAKLVFQVYRQINSNKYDIPYNRSSKHDEDVIVFEKEKREKQLLELLENSPLYNHKVNGRFDEYLIPEIINELIIIFQGFRIKHKYNNGCIEFPLLQWDGLIWLMKCSTYWKYKEQFQKQVPNRQMLTDIFLKLYLKYIEVEEVNRYNYFEKKEEKGLPTWSERIERLCFIDWIYPIYFIAKYDNLNSFLSPRLNINSSEESYNEKKHFTTDKLRAHIGVLLQILKKLVSPSIPYGFEKDELLNIKIRIEQQIVDYLKKHVKEVPQEGRIDLFDFSKERGFNSSEKEALLPQLARAINWFKDKEALIEAIVNSNDLIKILTLAEWITSEGVKKKLVDKVKQSDLQAFLEDSHWIPEIQATLLKITHYPELINQIEVIIKFWEEQIVQRDGKHESQLYQTRLLLSYFHTDEIELNSIKAPDKKRFVVLGEISNHDHKEFYRALIRLKNKPSDSYNIFNELSKRYPKYPVLAMNRMAAKISIANEKDDLTLYREAWEEWKDYINSNPEIDEGSLGAIFFANKMLILYKSQEFNELHKTYQNLDLSYQMLPDILDSKIKSLVSQKKIDEAISLLDEAERFHQFAGSKEIEFINDLKSEVDGVTNFEILRTHYNRIFDNKPTNLIKIFPEKLNGRVILNEFITNEIALATNKMLDKIMAISEINDENKYNDIVELTLDSRINPWGWSVGAQSRGGFSNPTNNATPKQPGERDLPIMDSNKKPFCVCEAFIYRNPSVTKDHLEKVFDYYHQKANLIMLIYNLKANGDFIRNWGKYLKEIIPQTAFPSGFEFSSINDGHF